MATFPDPNVTGLPEAVRVTLTIDPSFERRAAKDDSQSGEPPLTLQTTARVNMALFFYRSTGGSSSTNNAAAPEAQPQGGPQ
jgi:hypothetical protein